MVDARFGAYLLASMFRLQTTVSRTAGRLMVQAGRRATQWGRKLGRGLAGTMYGVWHAGVSRISRAASGLKALAREYGEMIYEVVLEMGFDNMLRLDPDERPLGGGETYLTVMTMYMLTRAAIDGRPELGGLAVESKSAFVRSMQYISVGLSIAQWASMVPVLTANNNVGGLLFG